MSNDHPGDGTEPSPIAGSFPLWSDDPATVDLLSFSAVAETVADAVLDDTLDPVALGLSGPWGSGKTTVLRLIEDEFTATNSSEAKVLVVPTDPWRYDPATGAKETLIAEVLDRLKIELENTTATKPVKQQALALLGKLAGRVDWARAIRLAARTSVTLQVPSFEEIVKLVRPHPTAQDGDTRPGLEAFREEFGELMSSEALAHVRRVVVLVDDLDRCLPETVIETLETIRLFLAVPKMSFVIAADEQRVADAIRTRFASDERVPNPPRARAHEPAEEPAQLYLHKIVQTTVPVPALSRFDTESYLVLLQLTARLAAAEITPYVDRCVELRRVSGSIDDLAQDAAHDIGTELLFAARLTPILYEKLRGNPRRIKRFLNDLHVRQSIAERRGITLAPEVVAKLMILEVLLPDGFKMVLDWLARNELRDQIAALENAAGRGATADASAATPTGMTETVESVTTEEETSSEAEAGFNDDLVRWAKLPPALAGIDLGPYLHLAAAFSGEPLLDTDLPERLRDLAANLLSSVRAEQKSVVEDDLRALNATDASALVRHLGRAARDRPTEQRAAVLGLLRITRLHPGAVEEAGGLLSAIPADEVQAASVLSFAPGDITTFRTVLKGWQGTASLTPIKAALAEVLKKGAS